MEWNAKPCPLCGSKAERPNLLSGEENDRPTNARCSNIHCPESSGWYELEVWNTRPIEDSLRARFEAAEEYIQALEELYSKFLYEKTKDAFINVRKTREAWEKAK